jgi:hypothetical protein
MGQTRTAGGRPETAGQVILLVTGAVAALLVIAGLVYAAGTGGRSQATLAAAGCEPGLSSDAQACTTQPMLAREYTSVITPAGRQLNVEAAAYTASEGHDLAAAEDALTAEVTTEQALGTSLASITFPPAMTPVVQTLIRANQARAKLTARQARSSSLATMRSFNPRVQAADGAVRAEMRLLLTAVDTPVRAG